MKQEIENMMQVGLAFGSLLGRFWVDFGAKLGDKLGPKLAAKREKRGSQDEVNKRYEKTVTPEHAGKMRRGVPLIFFYPLPRVRSWLYGHSTLGARPRGDNKKYKIHP